MKTSKEYVRETCEMVKWLLEGVGKKCAKKGCDRYFKIGEKKFKNCELHRSCVIRKNGPVKVHCLYCRQSFIREANKRSHYCSEKCRLINMKIMRYKRDEAAKFERKNSAQLTRYQQS